MTVTSSSKPSTGNRLWRRMLELDKPAPIRTDAEVELEADHNFRWNFAVNFLDGVFFWFGLSFISQTTIVPLFVSKISTAPLLIALVAVVGQASWYAPQLFTARFTERLPRKKPLVVNVGLFVERLPLFLLPIAALLSAVYPVVGLALFFFGYAAHGLGAGAIAPAWSDMLARCFPVSRRGRFFGITAFVGTGIGALGALFSGWLLGTYAFPVNFALSFLLAAVFILISWVFIALTREPVQPVAPELLEQRGSDRQVIPQILGADKNFRNYLLTRILLSFGNMAAGFLTVSAVERWAVNDSSVGLYTVALLLGQTAGNLLAGFVADHRGHKVALQIGAVALVVTYLLALVAPAPAWYFPIFFCMGISAGIVLVSGVLWNLEFSRPELRPTYIGLANTTVGIGNIVAPLVGGLAASVGYNWVFGLSVGFAAAGFVMLRWGVKDPRWQPSHSQVVEAEEVALISEAR